MKIKSLLVFGSMSLVGVAFMSCAKDIAFDSEAATQKIVAEYDANFVKKYGAIDPNQTWDFASMTPVRRLPSTGAATRAEGDGVSITFKGGGTMNIEKSVIDWMHEKMPAGKNNSSIGSPFCAEGTSTRNTFTIVPFYQGCASYTWELWVNVGGKNQKIWTKNQNLKYIGADDKEYDLTNDGVPGNAKQIIAPTITYEVTPGVDMYFYLKVWTEKSDATSYPDGQTVATKSSLNNWMRALVGLTKPAGVSDDDFVTLVGCEDGGGDNDYEDLAFMFIGPRMKEVKVVEDVVTKRYMMEDLGDTKDFDFNDVVVDVSQVSTKEVMWRENDNHVMENVGESEPVITQEAIVRAAGGIYNFTLTIGDTEWSKSDDLNVSEIKNTGWQGTSIDYDAELAKFDVTGWDPEHNNISLKVYLPEGEKTGAGVMGITFPRKGDTAPKMIAVDPSWNWMNEKVCVPGPDDTNSWWYWDNKE